MNKTIGIIGGTGLMGRWFERYFSKRGHKVIVASRSTELSIEDCAKESDAVIITVPMDATLDVIKKVGPLVREDGLLMDFTSHKIEPLKAMLNNSRCEVVGAHPVFGPGVKDLRNQTIVLCPGRGKNWLGWLKDEFVSGGAKVKVTTAQKHDEMMAVIQGVIHFSSISISHVLKELDIDVMESQDYSSPIYKLRMDMVGRILNQDAKLYANIEIMNSKTPKALKAYLKTCSELYGFVENKDKEGFINYFNEAADYLGDFKEEAEEYSNYLVDMLVQRKKKKGEIKV